MNKFDEYLDFFKDELDHEESHEDVLICRHLSNYEFNKENSSISSKLIDRQTNKTDAVNQFTDSEVGRSDLPTSSFTSTFSSQSSSNMPKSNYFSSSSISSSILLTTTPSPTSNNSMATTVSNTTCIPTSPMSTNCLINSRSESLENTQNKRRRFLETTIISTFPEQTNKNQRTENETKNSSSDSELSFQSMSITVNEEAKSTETNLFYGLPMKVKDLFKQLRNINCFYEWQHELLNTMIDKFNAADSNRDNKYLENLLYLSPTSGGKTLVAEMLILHCLLKRRKNCIFIMPFVSIVQEKVLLMQPFGDALNFNVEEYAGIKGNLPPLKSRNKRTLYICTIEKAHALINSLIETDRFNDELGLVCADELHMIGDGQRGCIYEMILSKVKYCSEQNFLKMNKRCLPVQIVATTATLQNKTEIAHFLNAYFYERHFRPVELKEYIKLDQQIFEVNMAKLNMVDDDSFVTYVRTLELKDYTAEMKKNDPDGLVALVREVIPNNSCLIFCSTKKNCENVASLLASMLPSELKAHKRDLKLKLFNELREENSNNICPVLRQSIQFGIAYHHSGLTGEERQLIEQAYREGVLCVITCTSTLAAGVNLPAKRVIIRSPYVAKDFISTSQYKQMIGRAGRAGLINSIGESILLFKAMEKRQVYDLISGPMRKCESSFEYENSKALRMLTLSLIGLNLTHFGSQILIFLKTTLFYIQNKEKLIRNFVEENTNDRSKDNNSSTRLALVPKEFDLISNVLDYLLRNNLIKLANKEKNEEEKNLRLYYYAQFEVTKLGLAAIKGNIDLDYVEQLYKDLSVGLKSIVLSNSLHLLYLCTPYELISSLNVVDYDLYSQKYCNLKEDEIKCARIIGIPEDYIQKRRFQSKQNAKVNENIVKRFYITIIIYELWKTNNLIWKVASEFQLDRGFVQQIIQSAASFTSSVLHFCEQLEEFWPYKNLLGDFTKRLQYNCSSIEMASLLEIDCVRISRAKQLFTAGYKSIEDIASANPNELSYNIKNLQITVAIKIIKSAKRILNKRLEVLQSEADNIILQLNTHQQL